MSDLPLLDEPDSVPEADDTDNNSNNNNNEDNGEGTAANHCFVLHMNHLRNISLT